MDKRATGHSTESAVMWLAAAARAKHNSEVRGRGVLELQGHMEVRQSLTAAFDGFERATPAEVALAARQLA